MSFISWILTQLKVIYMGKEAAVICKSYSTYQCSYDIPSILLTHRVTYELYWT